MFENAPNRHSDETIPARAELDLSPSETVSRAPHLLQQHFDGEIDLDRELNHRYYAMPVLSSIKISRLGPHYATALLTTQDGAAAVRVDVDQADNVIEMAFTLRSMLALKFTLPALGHSQQARWLDLMQHTQGRPAFLWGPTRWDSDYLITVTHQYYTNLYAFSSRNFEAAARLTPDARSQLLEWLKTLWQPRATRDDTIPHMTTW